MIKQLNNKGFTIVELLVAITFFSFLLLLVTYGFVQINRTYTRGITTKTIQETARVLTEDIARHLRFSDDVSNKVQFNSVNGSKVQIGTTCYVWNQHSDDPDESDNPLARSTLSYSDTGETIDTILRGPDTLCAAAPGSISSDDFEEILDDRAVVQHLEITDLGLKAWKIVVVISTKDANNGDLQVYGVDAQCKVQIGDQFCDVAKYETSVHTRN